MRGSELVGGGVLAQADLDLIDAARGVLLRHYKPFWHTIGAALRGRDGRIWTGVHLGATVGRLSVCAEAVALGRSVLEGDGTIECVVAVRHPKPDELVRDIAIVSPCGACREMITDFDRDASILIDHDGQVRRVSVKTLLPIPYRR